MRDSFKGNSDEILSRIVPVAEIAETDGRRHAQPL